MAPVYTEDHARFTRLCRLLIDCGTRILADVLEKQLAVHYPGKTLQDVLNITLVKNVLSAVKSLNKDQRMLFYPNSKIRHVLGPASTSVTFECMDITLLCLLLQNVSGLKHPAHAVWYHPVRGNTSLEADITRIRIMRNTLYGHITSAGINQQEFEKHWNNTVVGLLRLSNYYTQQYYDSLKTAPVDSQLFVQYLNLLKISKHEHRLSVIEQLQKQFQNQLEAVFLVGLVVVLFIASMYSIAKPTTDNNPHNKARYDHELHIGTYLPPRNPDFTGRDEILKTLCTKLNSVTSTKTQQQTISGLGGIGKSEIALEYAHGNCSNYQLIRWIHADTNNMEHSMREFADDLIDSNGQNKTKYATKEVTLAIYRTLRKLSSYLLVFDNAENYSSVAQFLPDEGCLRKGQHVLITSRSDKWRKTNMIDNFSSSESFSYLSHKLNNILEGISFTEADELGKRLGYLPLALSHAAAYMRYNGKSVRSYIKLLDEEWHRVLD